MDEKRAEFQRLMNQTTSNRMIEMHKKKTTGVLERIHERNPDLQRKIEEYQRKLEAEKGK